jgi:hypothetical protein
LGAKWADARKIPPKSHLTHHKMSNLCTALPPAAWPSLSMATSAMDPNCGATAPHETNRGARRPGLREQLLVPLFWLSEIAGCAACAPILDLFSNHVPSQDGTHLFTGKPTGF